MTWQLFSVVLAAAAAGINAGAFFAFSNFVMPALGRLHPADGASAMRAINRLAPNPLFVAAIVGAGAIPIPALVADWGDEPIRWLAAGVAASVASFLVTMVFNVPRNDALDAASSADLESTWADYLLTWTRWNTVRAVASSVSVAAFVLAARGR